MTSSSRIQVRPVAGTMLCQYLFQRRANTGPIHWAQKLMTHIPARSPSQIAVLYRCGIWWQGGGGADQVCSARCFDLLPRNKSIYQAIHCKKGVQIKIVQRILWRIFWSNMSLCSDFIFCIILDLYSEFNNFYKIITWFVNFREPFSAKSRILTYNDWCQASVADDGPASSQIILSVYVYCHLL